MRSWIPVLVVSLLWLLSYTAPWVRESDLSADSVWRAYSASGMLGIAQVELSGPDPRGRYGSTAAEELEALIAGSPDAWWHYSASSRAEVNEPGSELDRIQRRSLQLAWRFLVFGSLISACLSILHRRRGDATEA